MNQGRSKSILMIMIMLAILVSGCGTQKVENRVIQGAATEKLNKNELILAIGTESEEGFDPTTGWGQYGSPLFQSTLLKRDAELHIIGDLADPAYQISEDGLTWTLKLRSDVFFSDGEPLTAADVKFTFETAAVSGSIIDLTNMKKVEAVDEATVRFTLKEPQSTFISLLTTLGIVPEHAYHADYAQEPMGSGPYKLVQWDRGQQVIVERNDDYYGEKPFFKRLTFLFLEEDAAFAAAKSGSVDVAAIPAAFSGQNVAGMKMEAVKTVDNRGIVFPYTKSGETTPEGYPVGNDITADPAIRKAINVVIDRNAIVEGILEGHGRPSFSVADDLPWGSPEASFKDGNVEEAVRILEEAGWKDFDGDGIREKGNLTAQLTLYYFAGDMTRQSIALTAADMVSAAGIKINVEGKSREEVSKLMYANPVLFGWGSHDPLETYNLYSSTKKGIGYYNAGHYSNATVDEWMNKAMGAQTEEEAWTYWQKALWDGTTGFGYQGDAPWAWLVNIDHLYLVRDGLNIGKQQIHPHGHGWPVTSNIEDWSWTGDQK